MAIPKIPIDMKTLSKAGKIFESDADSETLIEVLVDTSARHELIDLAREVLTTEPGSIELNISGFSDTMPKFNNAADITIIIAGNSPNMRRLLEIALWSGLSCVVFTEDAPALVASVSGDDALEIARNLIEVDVSKPVEVFQKDFAQWCMVHLPQLRLSFGAAFPYMRKTIAVDFTRQTALENAAIGAVFLLPGADLPLLTLNQCKLLYQIAVINGIPLTRDRLAELAVIVVGAFACRSVTRIAMKRFGMLGWLVRGSVAGAATLVLGHLAYATYSQGGGLVELVKGALPSDIEQEIQREGNEAS